VITGIVVALSEEISTLTQAKLAKGTIAHLSDSLWLINAGAGAENAKTAAEALVAHGVSQLISWGCAAGLAQDLKPGDLILADRCIAADGSVFGTNRQWREHAVSILAGYSPIVRALAESKAVIGKAADKQKFAETTGAAALDMESVAVARVAGGKGLPFLVVRAIADPHDMALPGSVCVAVDSDGQVNLGKLLLHLLMHPAELPALVRLGRHFRSAKNTLNQAGQMLAKITEVNVKAA